MIACVIINANVETGREQANAHACLYKPLEGFSKNTCSDSTHHGKARQFVGVLNSS